MNPYWSHVPELASDLEAVLGIINTVNKSSEPFLNESVDYLTATGGKMLRPALFLMGAKFGPEADPERKAGLLNLAAAIENLHLATLIHDDIVDESRLRRGKETIQARYGKEYAVYMGDYLLCQCFLMLSGHPYDRETLSILAQGVTKVCLGEMRQYQNRHNMALDVQNYKKIIAGKTAALFAVSLYLGAWEAKAPDKVAKTLGKLGYCVGMAFQITDDLLDYRGDTAVFGKETLSDIRQGCYTLPLILGLKGAQGAEIRSVLERSDITVGDAARLAALLRSSGALEASEAAAAHYTRKAMRYLKYLPEGTGKALLAETLPKLLKRQQ